MGRRVGKNLHGDWLGMCIATGTNWLGRKTQQGTVLYIAGEGGGLDGIGKRCQRWQDYYQLPEPHNFRIIDDAFSLIQNSELDELCEIIDVDLLDVGNPTFIVIDTLARNLGGSDSSDENMAKFVAAADRLRSSYGSAVNIIHHTGWDKSRERGHSSLRCAADTMISMVKLGEHIYQGVEATCINKRNMKSLTRCS